MAVLYTEHFVQFFDDEGNPLANGKLYAYSAGTTTPKATYTTEEATVEHSNPIILDSAGRQTIFIQGSYRFDLFDENDVLIKSTDDVTSFTTLNESGDPFFQSFSGTGSQTVFTLSESLGSDSKDILVFVDSGLNKYATNGTFAADSDWTKGAGWSIGSGVATATGAISTAIEQDAAVTVIEGQSYTVTMTITRTAGGLIPSIGGTDGTERTAAGTYTETIIAGSTQALAFTGNGFTGTLDDVTVTRVQSSGPDIQNPSAYTLSGTSLTFNSAPPNGTDNILVFAPSLLLGEAAASAAAAAASEAAAAASEAAAATSETNAATSETNAATSETNAAASESAAATSETNAETAETGAVAAQTAAENAVSATAFPYEYDNTTSMADPGTGKFRLNNLVVGSATAIAIDDETNNTGNPDISAYIATWDDSTNTNKGTIIIRKASAPATFATFTLTGLTDNAGWAQLAVTYVDGNGSFTNTDDMYIQFLRTGDKGVDGAGAGTVTSVGVSSTDLSVSGSPVTTSGTITLDINTGAVVEGKIGDNAVTLAKMAGGTEGNIFGIDGSGDPEHIATGTAGQVLTSNGAGNASTFEDATGGGKILQVVSVTKTDTFTTNLNEAWANVTDLEVAITPASTSNTILIVAMVHAVSGVSGNEGAYLRLTRGGSAIGVGGAASNRTQATVAFDEPAQVTDGIRCVPISYIDSPASVSAQTYRVQIGQFAAASSNAVYINRSTADADFAYSSRPISTLMALEIDGS